MSASASATTISPPTTLVGQRQRPASSPANPHGHGFIAATSWKRAKVVARPTREIATRPNVAKRNARPA